MGNQKVERPGGFEVSPPAPTFDDSLTKKPDWNTDPGQFKSQTSPVPKTVLDKSPDGVMSFKNASNNPMDAPLPLGRSYSEFPASKVNDSRPRDRFQDKVDVRTISKGNAALANETGSAHS